MLLLLLLSVTLSVTNSSAFFVPQSRVLYRYEKAGSRRLHAAQTVIIGKIILDKYGPPDRQTDDDDGAVTIGGGGPQAAWGAAASLAVREYMSHYAAEKEVIDFDLTLSNLKHQITFLAPIGTKNWTPTMTEQLSQLLPPLINVVLVPSADHITPTINIWHDENENVRWMPVNGSFDSIGADGLWQNRPSAQDILNAIQDNEGEHNDIILHAIIESSIQPAGQGLDALPFFDDKLMSRVSTAGVEPIVFADDVSGKVSSEDSNAVNAKMRKIQQSFACARGTHGNSLFVVTPDRPCYEGMISYTNLNDCEMSANNDDYEMIIRDGGNGCFTNEMKMPAATLRTVDKAPVNPTGAGNAFSAAYVVCRGTGSSIKQAASIATAVGAVVCEYEHLPPWSLEVIQRIAEAVSEVQQR